MKKMIWGEQPAAQQAAAASNQNEESKGGANAEGSGAAFTGTVTPDQIVKEGWIYKRSRYLQQWKK